MTLAVTDEHESSLQTTREQHLQQLEEAKRATKTAEGLEEMKQQYLSTVEKIRGRLLLNTSRLLVRRAAAQVCSVWQET